MKNDKIKRTAGIEKPAVFLKLIIFLKKLDKNRYLLTKRVDILVRMVNFT